MSSFYRVITSVFILPLLCSCASSQFKSQGVRIVLTGSISGGPRKGGVSVAVADERSSSGRVFARTATKQDGTFEFPDLRLLPGEYLIAATSPDHKWQGADHHFVIGLMSFNKRFVTSITLRQVSLIDIDLNGLPLHFGVPQLFATDRNLKTHAPMARRSPLSFGEREIALPTSDSTRVIYGLPQTLEERDFADRLETALKAAKSEDILLYVHGYNNTFDDASLASATLQHGTRFDGVSLFFSWPSRGRLLAYWTDEKEVARSADDLERYLRLLLASTATRINVVAHSMGSRIVTEVLVRLAKEMGATPRRFQNIVLAAADIDSETLRERIPAILTVADRVTIYYSRDDKATAASKVVHETYVVGHDGITYASEAVDVIDATGVSSSFIAHSYLEDRPVLNDVFVLLHDNHPAAQRSLIPFDDFYRVMPFHRCPQY